MLEVVLTERAQEELDQSYEWWARNRSQDQANRWYTGFIQVMLTLELHPHKWPLAPENKFFPVEVRQLTFGLGNRPSHRALYCIRPNTVVILRIRHLAQQSLTDDDL